MSHYPKDVPFEVPEGWCFSQIGDVLRLVNGRAYKKEELLCQGKYRVLRVGNFFTNDSWYYSDLELDDDKYCDSGDLLYAWSASFGAKIWDNGKAIFHYHIWKVQYDERLFDKRFLYYFLEWDKQTILNSTTGSTMIHVSMENMKPREIVIPPKPEQKRIVSAIEKWDAVINLLERCSKDIQNTASIAKTKILDMAIHGKLVSQDPSDEPAIELLKRINPAFKPSDNLHYEDCIPAGWVLVRLGDIVEIISGTSFQKTDISATGTGLKILRGGNIQNGHIVLCDDDIHISDQLVNERANVKKGDIVIVASTGSSELIGKAALSNQDYPRTQIGAFLRIIRPLSVEISDYLGIIFQSEVYKKHIREVAKGTNINNIKASYITDFIVPMPPLDEQKRIILRLQGLLDILNAINYPE